MKKTIAAFSSAAFLFTTACATGTSLPIQMPSNLQDVLGQFGPISNQLNSALAAAISPDKMTQLDQQQASLGVAPTLSMGAKETQNYESATASYDKTVAQGAVLGAVVAGVGCKFIGKTDTGKTALCAAAGGLLGGIAGNEIAKKNKALIVDRENILAEVDQAEQNRAAARSVLAATESNIAYLETEVKKLETQRQSGAITQAQYQANMIEAHKLSIELASGVSKVKNDIEQQHKALTDLKTQVGNSADINIASTAPQIETSLKSDEQFLKNEATQTANRVSEFEQQFGAV